MRKKKVKKILTKSFLSPGGRSATNSSRQKTLVRNRFRRFDKSVKRLNPLINEFESRFGRRIRIRRYRICRPVPAAAAVRRGHYSLCKARLTGGKKTPALVTIKVEPISH